MKLIRVGFVLAFLSALLVRAEDKLADGFVNPPDSAKPHTWWHWMNGNVTKEGITADLEAMKKVGVGGAQIFNADCGIPPGPVKFGSAEWLEMTKHAVKEASRLGIELCIHNCAGWSSSGGPWNTPEHGMQIVVTSEKQVKGPAHFDEVLPQPPTKLDTYCDIAVLAFRTPASEATNMMDAAPKVTSSAAKPDGSRAIDGKLNTSVALPLPKPKEPQFILIEFAKPFSARTLSLIPGFGMQGCSGKIEVSDDGKTFRAVDSFSLPRGNAKQTFTFAPVSAKYFRLLFTSASSKAKQIAIEELELSPQLGIDNLTAKTFLDRGGETKPVENSNSSSDDVIQSDKIVDLTKQMAADGKLTWDAPEGNWTILRVGYTPNGRNNHPAPKEGTGLECDKLSKEAAEAHWAGMMGKIIADIGPLAGKTLNNVLIDSYEVGTQNWTAKFREEFQKRRGYDIAHFLPVFSRRIVDSPEITDRFLWDLRRTIADLFAENYAGTFAEMAHKAGMQFSVEPYGNCPTDDLQYGGHGDIIMGEFWTGASNAGGSTKLAAAVAHVYGRKYVGAESFTATPEVGRWLDDPYSMKALGDAVWCVGVNRFIFHRYAHQPWLDRYPGMTMGQWGFHFDRTSTIWEQRAAWLRYIARSQYLLQSGLFVADVCFFCGDGAPNSMKGGNLPAGYDYDCCSADALSIRMSVKDGRIVLPDGMSYRMLVLPNDTTMAPATLRKIKELAEAGATIVGPKPQRSPSLSNYPKCDDEVKSLADAAWTKVIADKSPGDVLASLGVKPDFECTTKNARTTYIHRTIDGAEVYFVSNQKPVPQELSCTFRVAGKTPELWHPETGKIEKAPVFTEADGRITVPLQFDPAGSVFVVFRQPAEADHVVAVKCNAASDTKVAPAELTIIKAEYGAFAAAGNAECADVTAAVKKMVKGGTRKIGANNDLAGGDPAPNTEKEMRIEFIAGGEHKTQVIAENKTIELPAGSEIIKAAYGVLSDEVAPSNQVIDITAKLASLVKDGALSVKTGNELAGLDPAFLTVKETHVEYRYLGATKFVRVGEKAQLELPEENDREVAGPTYELTATAGGKIEIEATKPASFELQTAAGKTLKAEVRDLPKSVEISGAWELNFPPKWGAPERVTLDKLISWTDHPDNGVKYFSGTATYTKEIEVPTGLLGAGKKLYLDLGALKNIAEVKLNGSDLGILWKPPFRADITGVAKAGKNKLEIRVTNLWPNRLIGDEQLPADVEWNGKQLKDWPQWLLDGKPSPNGRLTFTTWHHWTKDDALLPSGLFGPVTLQPAVVTTAMP